MPETLPRTPSVAAPSEQPRKAVVSWERARSAGRALLLTLRLLVLRMLVGAARAVAGRLFAYPLRIGVLAAIAGWYFTGLDWRGMALVGLTTGAGLWGLARWVILRGAADHSRSVTPLVKSLKLRGRVRRNWAKAMHRAGLEKSIRGGEPVAPKRRRVRLTAVGVATRVNLAPIGATADELRAKRRSLEASFRAIDSRVTETGPGWAELELRHTDPLNRTIKITDLPPTTRRGFVVVGIAEDGLGVEKELRLPGIIVGSQGSGKSTEVWVTLHQLIHSRIPFRLRVFDPKGGQEFTELAEVAYDYERNPLSWGRFLGRALGGLVTRQQDLASQGVRNLTWYTNENPLDIMIIDEMLTVAAFKGQPVTYHDKDGKHTLKSDDALMLFLSQGRAAGYTMLGLTQLAQKITLGPAIMELISYKTLLRVSTDEQVDMVMGIPGANKMYPAHRLPQAESMAGIGYVDTRETRRGVVKYRAALPTKTERRAVIRGLAEMHERQGRTRPQLRLVAGGLDDGDEEGAS